MEDQINTLGDTIQIIFEFDYNGVPFRDALYIPQDEYQNMTQDQIDTLKNGRFQSWIDAVNGVA